MFPIRDGITESRGAFNALSFTPIGWRRPAQLQSLSWFLKCLKEPLSRLANRQDKTRGAFFEQRFSSVGVLDEEALLTICVDIDLNPVAAGIVKVSEASPHTSVTARVDHVKAQGRTNDLEKDVHAKPQSRKQENPAKNIAASEQFCSARHTGVLQFSAFSEVTRAGRLIEMATASEPASAWLASDLGGVTRRPSSPVTP